jgi:hypothetical protein
LNVIVPVGLDPPANVPTSEIDAGTGAPGGETGAAVVTIVGFACVTVTDSFAPVHDSLVAALFASPL